MLVRFAMLMVVAVVCVLPCHADGNGFAADLTRGTLPYIAGVALWPVLTDGKDGLPETARILDGQIINGLITEGLKKTVHEWRPDHSTHDSFPSGHASAAFALAGAEAKLHPKQQWIYLGLGALISWSRVDQDRHYWHDVIAGAAIGYTSGYWAAGSKDGLLLGRVFKW